jgi:hypothetical protein
MRILLTIITIVIFTQLQAQINHRDSVSGTWICKEISFLQDNEFKGAELERMKKMTEEGLLNSKFKFNPNGIFTIQFPYKPNEFSKSLQFLNNRKWFFDPTNSRISIGNPKENLMFLDVKEEKNSVFFLMYETPIILKMQKVL